MADEIDIYTRSPAGPLLNWSRTAGPWARVSTDKNLVLDVPKETKPPLVVRWCTFSPRSSGGGIGDQLHLGALANEFPTSCSSCNNNNNNNKRFIRRRVTYTWMRCKCVTAHLEEGGGDGQVRVIPETHGEDGVYLLSLQGVRVCTFHC